MTFDGVACVPEQSPQDVGAAKEQALLYVPNGGKGTCSAPVGTSSSTRSSSLDEWSTASIAATYARCDTDRTEQCSRADCDDDEALLHDRAAVEYGTLAEQQDEASLDDRCDADDDATKGRLKFPRNKLYGRDEELAKLHAIFSDCCQQEGEREGEAEGKSHCVFLGGYSGTGKSALVAEFSRQLLLLSSDNGEQHDDDKGSSSHCFRQHILASGKCSELKSSDPLDAISEAMGQLVDQLLLLDGTTELLSRALDRLAKAGIGGGYENSEDTRTLVEMIPQLAPLLLLNNNNNNQAKKEQQRAPFNKPPSAASSSMRQDLSYFKVVFCKLLRSICSRQNPLIIYLDDLQWASATSLELIAALCTDTSMKCFIFIGSYRANEVNDRHRLVNLIKEVERASANGGNGNGNGVCHMQLSNLSPSHVGQFIADSIGRSEKVDEVRTIADVVYSKTLGNIFFVKQALEELVRRNALYYDVVTFRWEWGDVGRVDLERYLSNDVVEMVRSKISGLTRELQKALTVIAFTSNEIDVGTLRALLAREGVLLSDRALGKLLDRATSEGVLLATTKGAAAPSSPPPREGKVGGGGGVADQFHYFSFAHDRIQEAAGTLVPPGRDRDRLLVRIARVLADRGAKRPKDEWMLFVAARHVNSVRREHVDDCNEAARLNLRVAELATRKASFPTARKLARMGVSYLEKETCWEDRYDLCLDLYNLLARIEHALGNFKQALAALDQVLQNARTREDQFAAHDTRIAVIFDQTNHDYDFTVKLCIETLKLYGVKLPIEPSRWDIVTEKLLLRVTLGSRSLAVLTALPITRDDSTMKLLQWAAMLSVIAQNGRMALLVALRAVRIALQRGAVTKYLPFLAAVLGLPPRMTEKYKRACASADTAVALLRRFPDEDRSQTARIRLALAFTMLPLRHSFVDFIVDLSNIHWVLISHGLPFPGLLAARQLSFCFFAASLQLNSLLDHKLLLFQDWARDMGRKEFIASIKCLRQFVRNLRVKCERPAALEGQLFDEEVEVGELEGNAERMVKGDALLLRLQLAVIFGDESVMEDMLELSDEYPIFDVSIVRQHLRLAYAGFAGLSLAMREGGSEKKKKKYLKWGITALNHFRKLDRFGSPNAHPVYCCLRAVHEPSKDSFDKAILACSEANLTNLAAIMNERCAYFLMRHEDGGDLEKAYLQKALWLYSDWGATAKVAVLKEQHQFLCHATRTTEPPIMLDKLLRSTNIQADGCFVSVNNYDDASDQCWV